MHVIKKFCAIEEYRKMRQFLSRFSSVKCLFVGLTFVFLGVILLYSSSPIARVRVDPVSCTLCSLSSISFGNNSKVIHISDRARKRPSDSIDVLVMFSQVGRNPGLKGKLMLCLNSLVKYASSPLHFHIISDELSLDTALAIIKETVPAANVPVEISFYDVTVMLDVLKDIIGLVKPHFSFKEGAYYSDGLFFLSIGLFKLIPLDKVIIIDADVKFLNDIKYLHRHFAKFPKTAMIGIAQEQQPVYRHVLHEYRRLNNNSWIGGPPPHGFPGFNSGVLLMNLEKMRASELYRSLLTNSTLQSLVSKYKFRGHLGDQDFYTLISFEHPELFYTLPCSWNRQLCQWWRHHGYDEVFDSYHSCNGSVNLFHGNCNSPIDSN